MSVPRIAVEIPGPKAREVIERDAHYLATSTKCSPVVGIRGSGCVIEDQDGNLLLDFTSGIGVTNTGHCHPKVVRAIIEQAEKLIHFAGTDFYYDIQTRLAERLVRITPGDFSKKVFFTNSGTESVEAAIKICRWRTNKQMLMAFLGAFHGRTLGSLALTCSRPVHKDRFFPWMPGVVHIPFPNPYRPPRGVNAEDLTEFVISLLENHLESHLGDQVAALFMEVIQGEGGYIVPPPDFPSAVEKFCKDHGVLLVVDEVQSGFGRTGRMFACEHYGVEPDIVTIAKGMGSGLPIGAAVFRRELDFGVQGAHSNTFGGNPVACAASIATIDVIQEENLLENATRRGAQLAKRLLELHDSYEVIGDVRGIGLMRAAEFVETREGKEYNTDLRDRIIVESYRRGLILLPCGRSVIRFIPPLVVSEDEIDRGMGIFEDALRAALR